MKRTIFTLIVLMLLVSSGLSQGLLVGVVTDSLTQEPLIGANIYLEGTALGASTDMDGAYRIEAVPYGSYTLVFSYLGLMYLGAAGLIMRIQPWRECRM